MEEWGVWSYEGDLNDPHDAPKDKHGTSVCIGSVHDPADVHECIATACADSEERSGQRANVMALAPLAVRTLLEIEFGRMRHPKWPHTCPACYGDGVHRAGCELDGTLTRAGLSSAKERDEARSFLHAAKEARRDKP
jgi:hypothetical protein